MYEVQRSGIVCDVCGGSHYRFEQEVTLGRFPFYGYTCLGCGELMFMDKDACHDIPNKYTHGKVSEYDKHILAHNQHIKLDKPKNVW